MSEEMGGGGEGPLVELAFSHCFELFSTVVSAGTVFETLFPTTVETVNVDAVTAIPTFYRFGGHVSLCDWWDVGNPPPPQSLINRKKLL